MGGFVAKPIQGQPCSLRLYAIQRAFVKGFPQFYSPERTVVVFFRPLPHIWWPFLRKPAPFVRNFRKAAPGMRRQTGNLRARQNRAAGSRPRPTGRGNGDTAPCVHGRIKLHGRPAGRPYDLTGIGIYDFVRNFRKAVGRGNGDAAPRVHGKIKLRGRPTGRPYDRTYICNLPFLFAIYGRSLHPPAKAGGVSEREPG